MPQTQAQRFHPFWPAGARNHGLTERATLWRRTRTKPFSPRLFALSFHGGVGGVRPLHSSSLPSNLSPSNSSRSILSPRGYHKNKSFSSHTHNGSRVICLWLSPKEKIPGEDPDGQLRFGSEPRPPICASRRRCS